MHGGDLLLLCLWHEPLSSLGKHGGRTDAVHADPILPQIVGKITREHKDARFGRGVGSGSGRRQAARGGGIVYDRPPPPLDHPRKKTLHGQECGCEIPVDYRPPLFFAYFLDWSGTDDASTGECSQYVDGTEFLLDSLPEMFDGEEVGAIGGDSYRAPAFGLNVRHHRVDRRCVAAVHYDLCTICRQ